MRARFTVAAIAVCFLISGTASAETELHEKHRFDARPGATVVVDVSFHRVEVKAVPGDSVDVTVDLEVKGNGAKAEKYLEEYRPEFLDKGDKLIVRSVRKKKGWSWKSVSIKGLVTVQMPPDMHLTVDSSSGSAVIEGDFGDAVVRFDASSGSLTVNGAMGELHSDTSSGSVTAHLSRPLDAFTSDASSGSVRLTGGARTAKVGSSSGSINVSGLLGDGNFDASSGSIKAQWDSVTPEASVRASASSGSVTLRFPENTRISGTLDVSSGCLHSYFPALVRGKDKLELDGGPDAVYVDVDTSSGSIKLLANEG
jgi:DUF4097 and DUF4098 domain-containing protein YvlB